VNTIFSKLRDFVGLNESDYEYEYAEVDGEEYRNLYQEENPQPVVQEEEPRRRRARERSIMSNESGVGSTAMNNVIGMPGATNGMSEVVVVEPRTFEEMPQVLNLTVMDPDQAQRAVDFVAGGTYAIDGHQERIGESIFLFTPNCVQVSTGNATNDVMLQQARSTARAMATPAPAWTSEQARMA
jgi:cell division inhibitor SepF